MALVGMRTALRTPILDNVLSSNCYGLSPGACTAQSSSHCNRKTESSLWVIGVLEGSGIFVSGFKVKGFPNMLSKDVQHDLECKFRCCFGIWKDLRVYLKFVYNVLVIWKLLR
jgi:hypothetical protein